MTSSDEFDPFGIESEASGGVGRKESGLELLRKLSEKPYRSILNELSRTTLLEGAWLFDQGILAAAIAAQFAVELTRGVEAVWDFGLPVPCWVAESESARKEWVVGRATNALMRLLREDREAVNAGIAQPDELEPRHLYLVNFLGIEDGEVLGAAVRFNELDPEVRRAFFSVYVEGRDWSELAESEPMQYEKMNRLAASAMKAILGVGSDCLPEWPPSGPSKEGKS